jgi:hypothetical protein
VLDISRRGVLLEATGRVLPGARVQLQLAGQAAPRAVTGTVLRCHVSKIAADAISYRAAVEFDELLDTGDELPGRVGDSHPTSQDLDAHGSSRPAGR